jgi:Zn-finger nucleic acid-binding protein
MICPVCNVDMIVVEYHDIELDVCAKCRGVWFDAGELGLLLKTQGEAGADEFIENMKNSPEVKTSEKKRKCPICSKKMDKKGTGRQPPVIIDVCGNGHGLWFDGGEVVELARQVCEDDVSPGGTDNPAVTFLEEFFGTPE